MFNLVFIYMFRVLILKVVFFLFFILFYFLLLSLLFSSYCVLFVLLFVLIIIISIGSDSKPNCPSPTRTHTANPISHGLNVQSHLISPCMSPPPCAHWPSFPFPCKSHALTCMEVYTKPSPASHAFHLHPVPSLFSLIPLVEPTPPAMHRPTSHLLFTIAETSLHNLPSTCMLIIQDPLVSPSPLTRVPSPLFHAGRDVPSPSH